MTSVRLIAILLVAVVASAAVSYALGLYFGSSSGYANGWRDGYMTGYNQVLIHVGTLMPLPPGDPFSVPLFPNRFVPSGNSTFILQGEFEYLNSPTESLSIVLFIWNGTARVPLTRGYVNQSYYVLNRTISFSLRGTGTANLVITASAQNTQVVDILWGSDLTLTPKN